MAAGAQIFTQDQWLQLTDKQRYFRIEQKLQVDAAGWTGESETTVSKTVFVSGITLADLPVVALSSVNGTFARVENATSGMNVVLSQKSGGTRAAVTVYLFSNRRPPAASFGFELYDEGGPLMNSQTPILRPLGVYENGSYSGVSLAGRTIAHLPQRRSRIATAVISSGQLGSCTQVGGNAGYQVTQTRNWVTRMVAISGTAISVDTSTASLSVPLMCSNTTQSSNSGTQADNYRSLIVDVTGI